MCILSQLFFLIKREREKGGEEKGKGRREVGGKVKKDFGRRGERRKVVIPGRGNGPPH